MWARLARPWGTGVAIYLSLIPCSPAQEDLKVATTTPASLIPGPACAIGLRTHGIADFGAAIETFSTSAGMLQLTPVQYASPRGPSGRQGVVWIRRKAAMTDCTLGPFAVGAIAMYNL